MNQDNDRISSARGYENVNRGYEDDRERRDPYQHERGYDWNRGGRYDAAPLPSRDYDDVRRYEPRDRGYVSRDLPEYRGADRDVADYRGSNRDMADYRGSGRSMANYCPHCRQPLASYTGSDDQYFDRDRRGYARGGYDRNGYERDEHRGRNDYDRRWTSDGYEEDRRGR